MKRVVLASFALLIGSIAANFPAAADPGHARPRITLMRWEDPPVTASTQECGETGTCTEEVLILKAHDPDSSITEVQVWFDEDGERAPFVMAHTFCVQGKRPGKTARLEISNFFTEPGDYTVAAVAYSHRRCLGHEPGDPHASLHSRIERLPTEVEPAE
jgi:hypothetical protein